MKTEIIAVGTELLLGQVVNTNAAFLSQELASLGFEVYYQSVVGDNPERLEEALREADNRSDLIILCGGLGPTEDDLTKEVVAKHLGEKLVLDQNAMDKIKKFVERSGRALTDNNCRQALFIEHNQCVKNPAGLAVGCFVNKNGKNYLLLPGPPSELQAMFFQEARPLLQSLLPQKDQLISRVLRFYGTGESQLVTELADLIEHQENPTLAPYAKANEVTLRLTVKALNEKEGKDLLDELESKIMAQVGEFFYGYGDENSLEAVTVDLLIKANKTITSAESLTGGLFQSTLVNIPGVSQIFPGGFVTYSIREKMNLLKISSKVIERYGVVSEECAKEMADHARVLLDTDYALSFTGVAGPEELEGKEPGTVWIGLAKRGKETSATLFHFNRDRNYARQSAVMAGLNLIRKDLLEEKK